MESLTATPDLQPSSLRKASQRFLKSISARVGLGLTVAIILLALLAPVLRPFDPATARDFTARLSPPSAAHWWGTDGLGRDLLTLVWYGTRISLLISLLSVTLGLVIGTLLGLVAGYYRGWLERIIGWITDILLAFPVDFAGDCGGYRRWAELAERDDCRGRGADPHLFALDPQHGAVAARAGLCADGAGFWGEVGPDYFSTYFAFQSGSAGGAGDAFHWHGNARSRRAGLFGAGSQAADAGAGDDAVRFVYQRLCAVGSLDNFDAGTDDYADCAGI